MKEKQPFIVEVANDVGPNAAIVFDVVAEKIYLAETVDIEKYNGKYYIDLMWVRCPVSDLMKEMPYLSRKQIRTALDILTEREYLVATKLSDDPRDHALWYSLEGWSEDLWLESFAMRP